MRRRSLTTLLFVAHVFALTACAPSRPAAPKPEDVVAKAALGGYRSAGPFATSETRESWPYRDARLEVSVVAPISASMQTLPLVIYLPGLGEGLDAGQLWRQSWASAGYVVLAVQPSSLGMDVWQSRRARAGDFEGIAREHFSIAAARARPDYVDHVIEEIKRRVNARIAPFSAVDATRVVLAGFDLGAQTIAIAMGVTPSEAPSRRLGWNIRALVLISPYVDRADQDMRVHYSSLGAPILVVTGQIDVDPFHLLPEAAMRQVAWKNMPSGDKHLLVLAGGSHAMLAGSSWTDSDWNGAIGAIVPEGEHRGQSQSGGRKRKGSGYYSLDAARSTVLAATEDDPRPNGDGGARVERQSEGRRTPGQPAGQRMFDARQIAIVQAVSTAFLDAAVKSNDGAQQWLAKDAGRWIGPSAMLRSK